VHREYLELVEQRKVASDYDTGTEHKLHQGNWDWHSYVLKVILCCTPPYARACRIVLVQSD
jgi:hypothetical protein